MRWIAVFTALIGDGRVSIADLDGPRAFPTEQACLDHVTKVLPELNKILISYTANLDTLLIGECKPEEDL